VARKLLSIVGMANRRCEVCGKDYEWVFQVVTAGGRTRTFDTFECAIEALAPTCDHCGCKIIGHGMEANGFLLLCASCAAARRERASRSPVVEGDAA
jgi:hypothetical protein